MPEWTRFRGVRDVDKKSLMESLEENLVAFFNWGLLEADGYWSWRRPSTPDPEDETRLYPVTQRGFVDGRIWQARNRDWVWETGLESQRQPIAVSGVYVNGTFHPSNEIGTYKHYVNYPEGRVVFDTPLPSTSIVEAEYSSRWAHIYTQDVSWFRDIIFDAYRFEIGEDVPVSGFTQLIQKNAVQLPAIVVEVVGNRRFVPLQQGDKSQIVYQDFLMHILAENSADRSNLIDVITLNQDMTFYLFDSNARAAAKAYPFDGRGNKIPGAMTYPQLVSIPPTGFRWKKCVFNNMVGQETSARLPLYRAIIRVTLEVDFTGP